MFNPASNRSTWRLWTLAVGVLLCAGCKQIPQRFHGSPPIQPVVVPLDAGYCETNWAPLMTFDGVVESEVLYEGVVDPGGIEPQPVEAQPVEAAMEVEQASYRDSTAGAAPQRFDGRAVQPYPPSPATSVSVALTNHIERHFQRALEHDAHPSSESPNAADQSASVHSSEPERSLSDLIQTTSPRAGNSDAGRNDARCTPRGALKQASHVETILELLHERKGSE